MEERASAEYSIVSDLRVTHSLINMQVAARSYLPGIRQPSTITLCSSACRSSSGHIISHITIAPVRPNALDAHHLGSQQCLGLRAGFHVAARGFGAAPIMDQMRGASRICAARTPYDSTQGMGVDAVKACGVHVCD